MFSNYGDKYKDVKIDLLKEISEDNHFNRKYLSLNEKQTKEINSKMFITYATKLDDTIENLNAGELVKNSKGDVSRLMSINVFDQFMKMKGRKSKYTKDNLILMSKLYDSVLDKRVEIEHNIDNGNKLLINYYTQSLIVLGFMARYIIGKSINVDNDGIVTFNDGIKRTKFLDANIKAAKHLLEVFSSDRNFSKIIEYNPSGLNEAVGFLTAVGMGVMASVATLAGLFILRKLSWLFFYAKEKVSIYFNDVSFYIEQNIAKLDKNKDIKIIESQRRWIMRLRKWADSLEAKDNSVYKNSNKEVMSVNKSINNDIMASNIDKLQNKFGGIIL